MKIGAEQIDRKQIIKMVFKGKIKLRGRYYVEFLDTLRGFIKEIEVKA